MGSRKGLRRNRVVLVLAMALFCTTFGQPSVAGRYPLRYLLKDRLGMTASDEATFFLIGTFFWYLKPLAGLVSDTFPIFGSRRKAYLFLSALASALLWVVMGFAHDRSTLLVCVILLNGALVLGSTVAGGLLVEESQARHATGRLSALRQIASNVAILVAGPAGIWLYDRFGFQGAALVIGATFVPLVFTSILAYREAPHPDPHLSPAKRIAREFRLLLSSRLLWATAGMWALVVIAPGFGTLLVFRQVDVLHFPHGFVGELSLLAGAAGVAISLVYAKVCEYFSLRVLLPVSIALTSLGTLLYLHYDAHTAILVDTINGALGVLALLPLFDMAARATPRESASLGYSILMSVNNLVLQVSDKAGAYLYDRYHWSFTTLVWLNAITTLAALIAVPFLPKRLLSGKDVPT